MSPVAAGLDGLLALLLLAALVLGVRLNARLKTLRDGQAGFAAAVLELNQAAARAEAGLSALKTAQEDSHEQLLSRIEVARGLLSRLERATAEAERAGAQAERAAPAPAAPAAPAPGVGSALAAIAALAEGRTPTRAARGEPAAHAEPAPADPMAELRAGASARRRAAPGVFDEDLFERKARRPEPSAHTAFADDPLGLDYGQSPRAEAPGFDAAGLGALDRMRKDHAPPAHAPLSGGFDLGPLEEPGPAGPRLRPRSFDR